MALKTADLRVDVDLRVNPPPSFAYDPERDCYLVEGVRIARGFFATLAIGDRVEVTDKTPDGVVTIRRID